MQRLNTLRLAWISLAPLVVPTPAPAGVAGQAGGAVELLRDRVAAVGDLALAPDNPAGLGGPAAARLGRELGWAEAALAAEGPDSWLGSLRPYAAAVDALAQTLVVFESEPVEDLPGLAVEADALRALLDELGSPLEGRERRPAALQALLETSIATAEAYLVSAGRQGGETSVRAGVYYLKAGRMRAELARTLVELEGGVPAEPLRDVPGLDGYLGRLEAELLALYQPPLTQERHATFIGLSAGLKFAREQRDAGYRLGALEEALDVARGLALFQVDGDTPSPDRGALRAELEGWEEDLAQYEQDVSLPRVWLARARYELEAEHGDLNRTAALFERVLDDYFACVEAGADSAGALARGPKQPTVTVTLVRWPFT